MTFDAMDVRAAARYVDQTPDTVRRWIRSGRLSATRSGTRLLIARADLDALIGRAAPASFADWAADLPAGAAGGASAADLVLEDRQVRGHTRTGR